MKRIIILTMILFITSLFVAVTIPAGAVNDPIWYLHSGVGSGLYLMDTNNTSNGGTDRITLAGNGGSAFWIAAQAAPGVYSNVWWYVDVSTIADWGANGDKLDFKVGKYAGNSFTEFSLSSSLTSVYFGNFPANTVRQGKKQDQSVNINGNELFAVKIINNDSQSHELFTAESSASSRLLMFTSAPPVTFTQATRERNVVATVPGVSNLAGKIDPANGTFVTGFIASSVDGLASVSIPKNIQGHTQNGASLSNITIKLSDNPGGAPPTGAGFKIGNIFYDFGPDGAKFSGPVLISLPFDPSLGPDQYIAFWDTSASPPGWTSLATPFSINTKSNTISGYTNHFTVYTALVPVPPAATTPSPLPQISTAPIVTSSTPVQSTTPTILTPAPVQTTTLPVATQTQASPPVQVETTSAAPVTIASSQVKEPDSNLEITIGIMGAVVVIVLFVVLFLGRRRLK